MTEPKNEVSSPQVLSVATTITPLNLKESNMCVAWKVWKNQFKIFKRASNLNQRKVALLLHHLGSDCLQVFDSFDADMDTSYPGQTLQWSAISSFLENSRLMNPLNNTSHP